MFTDPISKSPREPLRESPSHFNLVHTFLPNHTINSKPGHCHLDFRSSPYTMGFYRSISFTPSSSSTSSSSSPLHQFPYAGAKSKFKTRSASLPCRSDSLVSDLQDRACSVRSWARSGQSDGATWISDGLSSVSLLLSSLLDLLRHPLAAEPLRQHRSEKLLEDILRLADVHSCFRDALLSLNQAVSETQAAARRRHAPRLSAAVRAQRRAERELGRFAASAREIARFSLVGAGSSETVLTISICDAVAAVAVASAGVFSCVVGMSVESVRGIGDSVWEQWVGCPLASPVRFSTPAASPVVKTGSMRKVWWVVDLVRWRWRCKKRSEKDRGIKEAVRGDVPIGKEVKGEDMERKEVLQRLHALEKCIGTTESGCADVYRALVNARVSLLNILTPIS